MQVNKYLYFFRYHDYESELCKLESRCIFGTEEKDKLLISDIQTNPSQSAFIKSRIDIISMAKDYGVLIKQVKSERIYMEGFKVEYVVIDGDPTEYDDRLKKIRDIGYSIKGYPDYTSPGLVYVLCYYDGFWCFGKLTKNNFDWNKHNDKPCTYSHSIGINIAKSLVNIATKSDRQIEILDACCGVGTIMLEACFANYVIEGCDSNLKICEHARENLEYFNYSSTVHHSDIKDISKTYGAAIVDLPYNLYSNVSDEDIQHIIKSTAKVAGRIVIVSTADISVFIANAGLFVSDICDVKKIGKTKFTRKIWVCENDGI